MSTTPLEPQGDNQGTTISYIRRNGDLLHIVDSQGKEYVYNPTGRGIWIPQNPDAFVTLDSISDNLDSPIIEDPGSDPTDGDSTIQGKLIAWHKRRLGRFHYSQSAGRLNPDKSGHTDCSGLQYACYKSVTGKNVGTNSRDQANNAHGGHTVTTNRSDILHGRGLQKGDLIFYSHPGQNWSHVEMYMGNEKVIGISNVHQDGSRIQSLSLQVNYFKGKLKVKRYV